MAKKSDFKLPLNHDLDEDDVLHPAIYWIIHHKQTLIWIVVALFAVLLVVYKIMTIQSTATEGDLLAAQTAFHKLENAEASSSVEKEELKKLSLLMSKYAELKPEYEGYVAQTLLIRGEPKEAAPLVQDIFQRAKKENLAFYQKFSKTSLLIAENQLPQALEETKKLNEELETAKEENKIPLLYATNLLRLAFLYEETGEPALSQETWKEFFALEDKETVQLLKRVLSVGNASLEHYIEKSSRS